MPLNGVPVAMKSRICCLAWSCCQPVKTSCATLTSGIFGERPLEALVAIAVGRRAGGAAHVDDVALAAHLLEQPFGAEIGVLLLVVGDDVGGRLGDRLVDGDDDDALPVASFERGVDAGWIGRVDDDGVDPGADQVADVLELAGRIGVAMGDVELGDLAGGERLRLDRADHLLAPAIALHGVGDADRVAVLARAAETAEAKHGRAGQERQHCQVFQLALKFLPG